VAGRTFTGSPTEHVGASLPSAWACSACLQAEAVRAACGKGSPGKLARCAPGIRHAAERSKFVQQAQQARAVPWVGREAGQL
jgi:hypothetical protein